MNINEKIEKIISEYRTWEISQKWGYQGGLEKIEELMDKHCSSYEQEKIIELYGSVKHLLHEAELTYEMEGGK